MTIQGFEIRAMTADDVGAAVALAHAQGWRDRHDFYEFVLRVPTCQALVGTLEGRVVATGLGTVSLPVGWVGAIVVAAQERRRGIGRAMTEEICTRLRAAGCETLSLEATDLGRPMYERMGFRLVAHYHQLQAGHLPERPAVPDGARVRRLEPADLPAVYTLDRQATSEDRSAPLTVLAESGGWVLEEEVPATPGPGSGLRGFLLPTERAYGAVIAPRTEDGIYLLDLHRYLVAPGAHVRAGVPDEHEAALRELEARGWKETWRAPRMLLGPDVPWRPDWIWGQLNSAMG
ncbi:MAG: GNAT family N-acetyltransferase [Candidatus Limnocylindrales bacterium]